MAPRAPRHLSALFREGLEGALCCITGQVCGFLPLMVRGEKVAAMIMTRRRGFVVFAHDDLITLLAVMLKISRNLVFNLLFSGARVNHLGACGSRAGGARHQPPQPARRSLRPIFIAIAWSIGLTDP
jgi:hypothetical protein